MKQRDKSMTITVYKKRPDLGENMSARVDIEFSDEDIRKIYDRYFELTVPLLLQSYSAYNEDGSIKTIPC